MKASACMEFIIVFKMLCNINKWRFLPRCVECWRSLVMRIQSARLSNAYIVTKGKKDLPDFHTIRKIIDPSFLRRIMVGGATPSTWNFGSTGPCWSVIDDFEQIFARSASAVTPSEKSLINTNRKSITRFLVSLRWSSYVAPKPPIVGSKTQNGHFWFKIALRMKKVC